METAQLKKFAQYARRSLMEQVALKLKQVLAEESAARRESVEAVRKLEEAIHVQGKDQVIERVAYIWFNRFCALRFMDVNRYTRIGVVSPAEGQFQPEILAEAKMGHIDEELGNEKSRQQIFDLLSGKVPSHDAQGEAYRKLVVAACNQWHQAMPFLFERIEDYTELLMPDDLLSGNSILAYTREAMTPDACEDVEVIGWLCQFYISEKKDEVFDGLKKNKKITPENIPAATQLFTPHWIVKYLVENSLGRLWMLNRPNSRLIDKMDYYIRPDTSVGSEKCEVGSKEDSSHSPLSTSHSASTREEDFLRIEKPEEIKICDPACGSGHMLTYAFDLLYAIYEEEGVDSTEIPEMILTHNLYGIEIDERAGELAAFALTMKARAKQRRFFNKGVKPNICVLENVHFDEDELGAVISNQLSVVSKETRSAFMRDMQAFEEADNFGSLIRPTMKPEQIAEVERIIADDCKLTTDIFACAVLSKVLQALRQADYLSPKYHVVIANPPYMGGKGMNGRLTAWAKDNYPKSKSDLFAMFIERNLDFALKHGVVGMITMQSWMFLSSFEALRARLLGQSTLLSMAHLGARAFDSIGGEVVSTTAFVFENSNRLDYKGGYLRLVAGNSEEEKKDAIREAVNNSDCGWLYRVSAADFKKIPGSPIAYWVSNKVISAFEREYPLFKHHPVKSGIMTGNDPLFLRVWQEVSLGKISFGLSTSDQMQGAWYPLSKGGEFRKWYGNIEHLINLRDDAFDIRNGGGNFRLREQKLYFKPYVTWSRISSSTIAFRYLSGGVLFADAAPGIFAEEKCIEVISLLNSKLGSYFLAAINPTMNYQTNDIERIPSVSLGRKNEPLRLIELAEIDWNSYEISWAFTSLALLNPDYHQPTLKATYQNLRAHWREMTQEMQRLEEENNRIFIEAYGLQDELTPEVPLNEITLTCNPHYRYGVEECEVGSEKWEEMETRLLQDTMKELVSYAVGCMFGRYSLDMPGLVLANQGESISDYYRKVTEYQKNECEKLSRVDCLAEGDGFGGNDIPGDSTVPEGGIIWSDQPDTEGGSVDSIQYSGGASQTIDGGVQKLSVDSTGFQSGSGNAIDDRTETWLSATTEGGANSQSVRGNKTHDLLANIEAITSHSPLPTSHLSFVPDEDNVIPMLDGDWFTDDIAERFRKFLRVAFGEEHYEENLDFVQKALGKNGKARDIRDYFLKDFYTDHWKRYKKRPIYWLFSSSKGSFNALIYMHRYRPDTVSVVLNDYLREFRTKLGARKNHLEAVSISASASQGDKTKALKEIEKINKIIAELEDYERDVLYPLATEQKEIDLDDGVKVNYPKFGAALKKIPGLDAKDE